MLKNAMLLVPMLLLVAGLSHAADKFSADKATGSITGVVTFTGDAPKMAKPDLTSDAKCAAMHGADNPITKEDVVVKDGKLKNVVVYVSKGQEKWTYDAPTAAVTIDQHGCQYLPHVLAMMAGQPLDILNSDALAHNIHAKPETNTEFNLSQANKGDKATKKFDSPEMGVRINCDVHKWMGAYANVFDHPFFAVTGDDGKFEIKVPPGDYEVSVWHETSKEGSKIKLEAPAAAKVTVGAGAATQNFEYKRAAK